MECESFLIKTPQGFQTHRLCEFFVSFLFNSEFFLLGISLHQILTPLLLTLLTPPLEKNTLRKMGYDVINVRYTRDKDVAHILNEMLLHLLRVKPKDPLTSLGGFLESSEGQNAIAEKASKAKRQKAGSAAPATTHNAPTPTPTAATPTPPDTTPTTHHQYKRGSGVAALHETSSLGNSLVGSLRTTDPEDPLTTPQTQGNTEDTQDDTSKPPAHPYKRGSGVSALRSSGRNNSLVDALGTTPPEAVTEAEAVPEGEEAAAPAPSSVVHEYRRGSGVAALNGTGRGSFVGSLHEEMNSTPATEQISYKRGSGVGVLGNSCGRKGSVRLLEKAMEGGDAASREHTVEAPPGEDVFKEDEVNAVGEAVIPCEEYHSDNCFVQGYTVWGTGISLLRLAGSQSAEALFTAASCTHSGLSALEQTGHSGHKGIRSLSLSADSKAVHCSEAQNTGLSMLSQLNASTSSMLLGSIGK